MADLTFVIPTRNRAPYLQQAISSALGQTEKEIIVLVLDNASDDATPEVVAGFEDSRIIYVRHENNIGIIQNWNYGLQFASTPFINILGDDDILHSEFASRSLAALRECHTAAFSFTHVRKVDLDLRPIDRWGYQYLTPGIHSGKNYILASIELGCCLSLAPSIVMRKDSIDRAGLFTDSLAFNTFDFNFWLRLAAIGDVYFLDEVLLDYRIHPDQMTETYWRKPRMPLGLLGSTLELLRAASGLLQSGADQEELKIIREHLPDLVSRAARYSRICLPDL